MATTPQELTAQIVAMIADYRRFTNERRALVKGVATYQSAPVNGVPQPALGWYPVTDIDGLTTWEPCQQRILWDAMATTAIDFTGANTYTITAAHSNRFINVYNNGVATVTLNVAGPLPKGFNCIIVWAGTQTNVTLQLAANSGLTWLNGQGMQNNNNAFLMRSRGEQVQLYAPSNNFLFVNGGLRQP